MLPPQVNSPGRRRRVLTMLAHRRRRASRGIYIVLLLGMQPSIHVRLSSLQLLFSIIRLCQQFGT
jgi:hypothetical protein